MFMSQLNKSKSQEESDDPLLKLINKNPCGICRANRLPICKGHGKSGGGGGGLDSGSGSTETKSEHPLSLNDTGLVINQPPRHELRPDGQPVEQSVTSGFAVHTPEVFDVEDMAHLYLIHNNSEYGILTIRLQPAAAEESKTQDFLHALKMEFNQFKNRLEKQGINVDSFIAISKHNELVIRISSPKYYDAFIQQLVNKKVLAKEQDVQKDPEYSKKSDLEQDEELVGESSDARENASYPTPFKMSLRLNIEPWQ